MFLQAKWIVLLHHWSLASLSVLVLVKFMTALLTNPGLVFEENQCLHLTLKELTKNLDQTVGIDSFVFFEILAGITSFPILCIVFCEAVLFCSIVRRHFSLSNSPTLLENKARKTNDSYEYQK